MGSENEKDRQRDRAERMAFWEAGKWGFAAGAPAVALSFVANKYSEFYRKRFSISAKVATPLMLTMLVFAYRLETVSHSLANEKEKWGLVEKSADARTAQDNALTKSKAPLPVYKKAMKWWYDNPFESVFLLSVPLVGGVLYNQMQHKHLKFQQRLLHSRVLAQGGILAILTTTMAFRAYMNKYGNFEEDEEDVEEHHY